MGDPSTGKSQILRYAARIAPKSIYVAGKTASGAGLTASAEKDELGDGGWVIKAGALVLASGGIAAVDEFEKIDAKDRAALHEAMEQQSYDYDFEILLSDGRRVKIGELVDRLMEADGKRVVKGEKTEILPDPGIELIGYSINSFRPVIVRADRISRHLAPEKIVELEFSNGRTIRVTPEHPVMIWKSGKVKEVPAEEVCQGDVALAVRQYPIGGENVDPRIARFLGFILSKGSICEEEDAVEFTTTDKGIAEEFRELVDDLGEVYDIEISKKGANTSKIESMGIYHRMQWEFPELFHGAKEGYRIPGKLIRADEGSKIAFLDAYFRCMGFASRLRAGFKAASRKMAEDLQDLLY